MAKPIREVTVILLKPAKKRLTINRAVIAKAPALFMFPLSSVKAIANTFTTGSVLLPAITFSTLYAAYKSPRIYASPVKDVAMQVYTIPLGAEVDALTVSSAI